MNQKTVLITDYAWPDLAIERAILERAGLRLVAGPAAPASAEAITALVQAHQPDSILTCWAPVHASAIAASAPLVHVGRIGVGLDNIDVSACTDRGVRVTNVPDYCVEEVSDHAVGFALAAPAHANLPPLAAVYWPPLRRRPPMHPAWKVCRSTHCWPAATLWFCTSRSQRKHAV